MSSDGAEALPVRRPPESEEASPMKKSAALAATSVAALFLVSGCQTGAEAEGPATHQAAPSPSASASAVGGRPAPGDSIDPAEFLEGIFAATQEAGSARFTFSSAGGPDDGGMSMKGAQDFNTGEADLNTTVATTPGRKAAVTMRLVDGVVYANVPGLGGGWVSIGPQDIDTPLGSQFLTIVDSTPMQQFEDTRDAVTAVEVVGPEDLAGEPTTRYKVTIDPAKVTGQTAEQVTTLQDAGPLLYDYWLDGEGHMRKIENGYMGVETVMEMSGWGEPVDVEAPDPSTVTPARDIGTGAPTQQS
jgi:hypothetical protein